MNISVTDHERIGGHGMHREKVLFVCIHNSARSQMAEGWLNHLYGERFEAHSAGLAAGKLNPVAVTVMKEVGIDISQKKHRRFSASLTKGLYFLT